MRFYQLGGGQLGMVEEPQSQIPSPQMQQAPQQMQPQMQQQVNPQDQTMQMFQMYFDKIQMSQEEIEQFMQEFQALQPQEQQKVLEYIGQSLQEPQQQEQQPQMQQEMSQEQPMMQAGGRYKRMYQGGVDYSDMDTNESLQQRYYPQDNQVLQAQSFAPQATNQVEFPMLFQEPTTQVVQTVPAPVSTGNKKKFYLVDGQYIAEDGTRLPVESIAGSTGHYDFKGNPSNTSVSVTKYNEAVTTPITDQTKKQRLVAANSAPAVMKFQEEVEKISGIGTGKIGKDGKVMKGHADGLFGANTYNAAKVAYKKVNNIDENTEVDNKDVNAWILTHTGVKIPSKYVTNLDLPYDTQKHDKGNTRSDSDSDYIQYFKDEFNKTPTKQELLDFKLKAKGNPVNPAVDDNGFIFVKKADDGVGQILKDKSGNLVYKSATGEFWDSNANKLDIQGGSKAIPITDVGKVAAIAEARKDSSIIKDKSGLFDLSGYGKKEIVAVNDIPKLVGDQNYYNQVNTTLKSVSNGYMGANNMYQSARNPDQYSNQFIDIGGGLAFDPSTNLFLERSVSGSYHKPSSTKIESYLNTPKGEIFKQDYKAGTLVKKKQPSS